MMKIKLLELHFTVCQIADLSAIDWSAPFSFVAKTDEEWSLVCPQEYVPAVTLEREDGWRAMRIEGTLDFSLVGILARLTETLAQKKIPVFAVSTYNTDYILVKHEKVPLAIEALNAANWDVEG